MAKNRNKESTRYYSERQEEAVCKALGAKRHANSGATKFKKGDCSTEQVLIECKTCLSEKDSFSIKREWIEKNRQEAREMNKPVSALAFNFGPDTENHYIISETVMKFLVEKLEEELGK